MQTKGNQQITTGEVLNMVRWNSLTRAEQLQHTVRAIDDVKFFCSNEYFLNLKLYDKPGIDPDKGIGISQVQIIDEFFKKKVDTATNTTVSIYNELVLALGMRASKTFLASIISVYEAFGLLVHEDPASYWNLAKGSQIFIINAAKNEEQAKDTVFAQTKAKIDNSPWFQGQMYKERTNEFNFESKNIVIRSGSSNSDALVGKTAKLALFDEIDRFQSTDGKSSGWMTYTSLGKSTGTFGHEGKKVSLSSPLTMDGVILTLARRYSGVPEEKFDYGIYKNNGKLVVFYPTWMLNPTLTFEMLWEEYGQWDAASFWRDFGAKPSFATTQFYKNPDSIKYSHRKNLAEEFCDNPSNAKTFYWDYQPEMKWEYKLIGDPAQKDDAFAFAIVHLENGIPIVDAVWRLVPENGVELKPSEVKEMILSVTTRFAISEVLFDQDRFPEITESLNNRGVEVILHMADYITHRGLKSRILLDPPKVEVPFMEKLHEEFSNLLDIKGKQVEHPERKNSKGEKIGKDMVDVCANGVWLLVDSKNIKKDDKAPQMTFIMGMRPWTSAPGGKIRPPF